MTVFIIFMRSSRSKRSAGHRGSAGSGRCSGNIFTFALGKNTGNSNLFKKFTVVAIRGGVPTQVSNACYITNPEAVGDAYGSEKGSRQEGHPSGSDDAEYEGSDDARHQTGDIQRSDR
jgi:hypothetical protein